MAGKVSARLKYPCFTAAALYGQVYPSSNLTSTLPIFFSPVFCRESMKHKMRKEIKAVYGNRSYFVHGDDESTVVIQ